MPQPPLEPILPEQKWRRLVLRAKVYATMCWETIRDSKKLGRLGTYVLYDFFIYEHFVLIQHLCVLLYFFLYEYFVLLQHVCVLPCLPYLGGGPGVWARE